MTTHRFSHKLQNMFNAKILIGFSALALLIGILSGLAGGVPFGAVLLRTLVGIIVFAGLGVAAGWLINKYVPEIFKLNLRKTKPDKEPQEEGIDIVLPEENPHTFTDKELSDEELADEEKNDGSETVAQEDMSYEPLEKSQPLEQSEQDTADDEGPIGEGPIDDTGLESFADVDILPSLDNGESVSNTDKQKDPGEMEKEPSSAAQAIRTWLKKG